VDQSLPAATPYHPLPDGSPAGEADAATRGSAIKLGAETLGRLIGMATAVAIVRVLGPEEYGTFTTLSVGAVVAAEAADLGLQGTASQALVAGSLSLRSLGRVKLVISGLVLLAAALAAPFLPLFVPLLAFFTLAGWSEFLGVALRARGHAFLETVVILCLRAAGLVAVGAVMLMGPTLHRVAWGQALSPLPPILLGAWLLHRTGALRSEPVATQGMLPILRRSFPLAVNGGLALLSLRVELLAVKFQRGAYDAGLFAVALRVVEFLNMVPSAICAGAMPALTREALRGEGPVRRRTGLTAALLAAPAAAGLFLVAPEVVILLGGREFAGGGQALRVMALALLPLFLNAVLLHALIAAGHASTLPRLTFIRVMAATLLALVLVPRFGIVGGAVGFVLSEVVLLVLAARACASVRFPVPVLQPFLLALAAAAPMGLLVAAVGGGLALSVLLGIVAYGLTLTLAWRFTPVLAS
jgi:O-antigen/teichoic acid export membrane protein